MRNKLIACIMLLLLPLAACAPAETAPDAMEHHGNIERQNNDYDNRFGMNYANLIETEDAYYFCNTAGTYIYYFDKASGEKGVLCAKPECVHDADYDNPDCNGRIDIVESTLNFWEGKLHYWTFDEIMRKMNACSVNPDGSGKTVDAVFDYQPALFPDRLDFHRGMLYGWREDERIVDGEPMLVLEVIVVDPETGETNVIYQKQHDSFYGDPMLYYFGKYVYFTVSGEEGTAEDFYTVLELLRWNTETEELETVYSSNGLGNVGTWFGIYMESEDRIWLAPRTSLGQGPVTVQLLESGELNAAFRFENSGTCFLVERAAVCKKGSQYEIRSLDGSRIFKGELSEAFLSEIDTNNEYSIKTVTAVMGCAEEIFVSFLLESTSEEAENMRTAVCLVRYDLTEDDPVPVVIAYDPWAR